MNQHGQPVFVNYTAMNIPNQNRQEAHRPQHHPTPIEGTTIDRSQPHVTRLNAQETRGHITQSFDETAQNYYKHHYYDKAIEEMRELRAQNEKLLSDNYQLTRHNKELREKAGNDAHALGLLRARITQLERDRAPTERKLAIVSQQLSQTQGRNYAILEQKYHYVLDILRRHHTPVVPVVKDGVPTVRIAEEHIAMKIRTNPEPSEVIDLTGNSPTNGRFTLGTHLNQNQRPRSRPRLNPNVVASPGMAGPYHHTPIGTAYNVEGPNLPPERVGSQIPLQRPLQRQLNMPTIPNQYLNVPFVSAQQRTQSIVNNYGIQSANNTTSGNPRHPGHARINSWPSTPVICVNPACVSNRNQPPVILPNSTRVVTRHPQAENQYRESFPIPIHRTTRINQPQPQGPDVRAKLVPAVFCTPHSRSTSPPVSDISRPQSSVSSIPSPFSHDHLLFQQEHHIQVPSSSGSNPNLVVGHGSDSTPLGSTTFSQPDIGRTDQNVITPNLQHSEGTASNEKRTRDSIISEAILSPISPVPHPGVEGVSQYIPQANENLWETSQIAPPATKRQRLSVDYDVSETESGFQRPVQNRAPDSSSVIVSSVAPPPPPPPERTDIVTDENVSKSVAVDPSTVDLEKSTGTEVNKSVPPTEDVIQSGEWKDTPPRKDDKNAKKLDTSTLKTEDVQLLDTGSTTNTQESKEIHGDDSNNNNYEDNGINLPSEDVVMNTSISVDPIGSYVTYTSSKDTEEEEEEDEGEEEEEDELYDDLTDDEDSKLSVIDCISQIFFDNEADDRHCIFCNKRAEIFNLPNVPEFSDSGIRELISHAKNEHPDAWIKIRTRQV